MSLPRNPTHDELSWCLGAARAPRRRSMRQFYEQELVIPEGKYEGRRWRAYRQPYAGALVDAIDQSFWPRISILGCVQSGKSFNGWVGPICFHLFECKESVIAGVPTMDISGDKWEQELLPVIKRTRYASLLPKTGAGSRGGKFESITFTNGATLKFMSGHGGDEKRSSFTARVVVCTEVDKFDRAGEASREADPISQLEARTLSYEEHEKRIYLECTVSIKEGRIWQEYTRGTKSRLVVQCPYCREWVTPEREHLLGVESAETAQQARDQATWACPSCAALWDDAQRRDLVQRLRLVHDGQEIDHEGQIHGQPKAADTLGFRWSAFFNLFWTTRMIAGSEWEAKHESEDEENAEKERSQFWWATPYTPPIWDTTPLDAKVIRKRMDRRYPKGEVPADAVCLTCHFDPGKRVAWWGVLAFLPEPESRPHIVDYGTIEVPSDDIGEQRALLLALRNWRDRVAEGWIVQGSGDRRIPDAAWVDAAWQTDVVAGFIRETVKLPGGKRFRPTLGRGTGQLFAPHYERPKKANSKGGGLIRFVGEEYHIVWDPAPDRLVYFVEVSSDHWKSLLHNALSIPEDKPGAMTFYHSLNVNEHLRLSKHFTAEKGQEEFVEGKGTVVKWVAESRANHYFDVFYNCLTAGHWCGVRLERPKPRPAPPPPPSEPQDSLFTTPDGRPFLATDRP